MLNALRTVASSAQYFIVTESLVSGIGIVCGSTKPRAIALLSLKRVVLYASASASQDHCTLLKVK